MKKFIRKLRRISTHSYSLVIPKEMVKKFKWQERQKIEIIWDEKKKWFKVKDWHK